MLRRLGLLVVIATVLVGGGVRAWADGPAALDLVWEAPADCPDAASVEREVRRLLGPAPPPSGDPAKAAAAVSPLEHGWRVVLLTEVHGVHGQRTLEARSCEGLAHATALVLALTIDPQAVARETDGGETTSEVARGTREALREDETTSAAAIPLVAPPPAASTRPSTSPSRAERGPSSSTFAVGAGVVAGVGALPGLAFAPEIAAGWSNGRWRIDLAGAYFPPTRALVDATRGGEFRLVTGSARACRTWAWANGAFELGPCIAFEGGVMTGQGVGIRLPGAVDAPWLATRAGAWGALRLAETFAWLVLALEAEVPLTRDRFAVDGLGTVHHPSALTGRASFGAEARF